VQASSEALRYRLGAGYAGVLIGWSARAKHYYLEVIPPDDLRILYASDDPSEPTVIRHSRSREIEGEMVAVVDEYDLRKVDAPIFRVLRGEEDVTSKVLPDEDREGYWWRYEDGTPFHRIVITGSPRYPYATNGLIEASLGVPVLWTHWRAGVRDAGFPQRNAIGLRLEAMESDASTGEQGIATGPETCLRWVSDDPERPGVLHQWGPGFDPKVVGEAV
jgi:hypothetical protein